MQSSLLPGDGDDDDDDDDDEDDAHGSIDRKHSLLAANAPESARGVRTKKRSIARCIKGHHSYTKDWHRRVVAESTDNKLQQERMFGTPVEYGQVIQLYSPLYRKFVRVSSSRSAEADPSNMRIELNAESTQSCSFRIMPRYKIRSIGDFICQGDDILLEELDIDRRGRSQYIHGCKEPLSAIGSSTSMFSSVGSGQHEAVLSAEFSGSTFNVQCISRAGKYAQREVPLDSVEAFMRKEAKLALQKHEKTPPPH